MRRVRRPKSKSELLDVLTDSETGVFETYKDALLFAGALGAFRDKKVSFEKSDEPIDYSIFSRKSDNEALLLLLAVYTEENLEILSQESGESRLKIFEEYANGGLEIIEKEVRDRGDDVLNAIEGLVQEAQTHNDKGEKVERDFSAIMKQLQE